MIQEMPMAVFQTVVKDSGGSKRVESLRFKSDCELLELAGKPLPRSEVVALLVEGFNRGMLNADGESRLLALLQQDVGVGGSRPLRDLVDPDEQAGNTPRDKALARLLKAAGLTREQAIRIGKPGITLEDYQKIMAETRAADELGNAGGGR